MTSKCQLPNDTRKALQLTFAAMILSLVAAFPARAQQPAASPAMGARVGIVGGNARHLTVREAIALALENNRDIEIERLNTQMSDFDLRGARGAFDPVVASRVAYGRETLPVASVLAGTDSGNLRTSDLSGSVTLSQRLRNTGGEVSVGFNQNRLTSGNLFNALNPMFTSQISVELTQPLLRNRRVDESRRDIKIARKRLDLSDSQFRQRVIEIIAGVERAYWDLVFSRRDAEIKLESVALAQSQLEHSERLAKEGTRAFADVTSARVELDRRADEAEAAIDAIQRSENALKALILPTGEAWSSAIVPTEEPKLAPVASLTLHEALSLALSNRPEMEQFKLKTEVNKIDRDYLKNQTKPQINLIASYSGFGLAGKERKLTNPIVQSNQLLVDRLNQLSGIAGLPPLPPVSLGGTPAWLTGGYGTSLNNLFGDTSSSWKVGFSIDLTPRNRTAKAKYGRSLAEGRQIDAQREKTEQQIEVEVRNSLQGVETTKRRAEVARSSRESAEQQYQSEKRKFDAGQSTTFFVLDRQNALTASRGRELKALTDYTKALAELQRSLSTTLAINNVALASRAN